MDASQLDTVSAVLGAIAASAGAGAGDAIKETTKGLITGTRDRLIALVRGRLKKDPLGEAKLTVYAAEPTPANGQALHGHLLDVGIDQDAEILTLARELLRETGPAAVGPGSVAANVLTQINKDGSTGYIGGQHVHHHNYADRQRELRELGKALGEALESLTPPADSDRDIADSLIAQRTAAEAALSRWGHLLPKDARDQLLGEEQLLSESQAYLAGSKMGLTWTAPTEHLIPLEAFPVRVHRFAKDVREAFLTERDRVGSDIGSLQGGVTSVGK